MRTTWRAGTETMPRRGKRIRLAKAIYQDESGVALVLQINRKPQEFRQPLGLDLAEYQRIKGRLLAKHEQDELRDDARRQSLAADITTYLATLPKGGKQTDRRRLLEAWALHHEQPRSAMTSQTIREQLAAWQDAGFAPSTINHRRQALLSLYQTLDGRSAANPVRDVPRVPRRVEEPRGLPYDLIELILSHVPERGRPTGEGKGTRPQVSQTRARLRVMAYTGLPQAQIGRLLPRDLHLDAATLYVRPRRKGAGVPGRTLPLVPPAVEAFRAFVAANAWGPFSHRAMAHSFTRAIVHAKAQWATDHPGTPWPAPHDVRPYDLRHSWATLVYRTSRDLRATAELLLHADMRTTSRYAAAAVTDTARAAADAVGAMLVPRVDAKTGENAPHLPAGATARRRPRQAKHRAKVKKIRPK